MLIRFARIVASATPSEIMPALAEAAVENLPVDGAAVLRVDGERASIVAGVGLPEAMRSWSVEVDALDSAVGTQIVAASAGRFLGTILLPLVSGNDLYGVLVLLGARELDLDEERLRTASALADLAAISLARAAQVDELRRSYEELRESREILARSEKLRALGQMAAGVAHDLKNILNPLALQLRVLEKRIETDPAAAHRAIDSMKDVIKVGVETIERLTAFSRQAPERDVETAELVAAVRTATGLGRARLAQHRGIELVEDLAPAPAIRVRTSDLVSAVVNLILNATEAMAAIPEGGGRIAVRTGTADGGAWVEVADNGPGMPPDIESRVFEPFFTTKREGTGLGLAMVYAFVQRQGGKLTLDTAPGRGATFRMWFPART